VINENPTVAGRRHSRHRSANQTEQSTNAYYSMAIGFSPTTATGGHFFSPLVATNLHTIRVGRLVSPGASPLCRQSLGSMGRSDGYPWGYAWRRNVRRGSSRRPPGRATPGVAT
jgi:hypothetical protein